MKDQKGFTLIELLVVVTIIGILASIAIPIFASYKRNAFDARAKTDLRNIATAEEAYFADNAIYKNCTDADCALVLPGIIGLSKGVTLAITATTSGFIGTSSHSQGTSVVCTWNSATGGLTGC